LSDGENLVERDFLHPPPNKNNPEGLFFAFFMRCILFAPFTKLLELNLALNFLLVLAGPIIGPLASFTG
jgi:hypothetical protein